MSRNSPFLPDANIWINALNQTSRDHAACRQWLDQTTAAGKTILINDLTECALLRLGTHPQLNIATPELTVAFYQALLNYPQTKCCSPGQSHRQILADLITELGLSGNDINDAWLAALALEHKAILVSLDNGFARFPKLKWLNPAASGQT